MSEIDGVCTLDDPETKAVCQRWYWEVMEWTAFAAQDTIADLWDAVQWSSPVARNPRETFLAFLAHPKLSIILQIQLLNRIWAAIVGIGGVTVFAGLLWILIHVAKSEANKNPH